jgi:hypothetical protein
MAYGRAFWSLGVVCGVIAGAPAVAGASDPTYTLKSDAAVFVRGEIRADGPRIPGVTECQAVACRHAKLRVRLPQKLRSRPGGVQVAIRYTGGGFGDALGLHVYRRGGPLVASSTGQVGTAQSVLLPKADRDYDVYVAFNPLIPEIAQSELAFEGLAENEDAPPVRPLRRMLPDLEVLAPRVASFGHPEPIFGDAAPDGSSCFGSEIDEQGARVCLRFGQRAANIGSGPVDVRWSVDAQVLEPVVGAVQRVYRSDGAFAEQSAGSMHYHAIHSHYHFQDFSQSTLHVVAPGGLPRYTALATGRKNGFCMADTEMHWWGLKGDAPQTYPAPGCLEPRETVDGRVYFQNGISRGWADEYTWDLPDQMIEVSRVRDGTYWLVTRIDTANKIEEESDANNCLMIRVKLTNVARASRSAALVGSARTCAFA